MIHAIADWVIRLPFAGAAASVPAQAPAPVPVPAPEQAQEYNYSIRFFFDWHQQLLKDLAGWISANGRALIAGLIVFALTILFCLVIRSIFLRVLLPRVEKKFKNTAKELRKVSTPVGFLFFWLGFSLSISCIPFAEETQKMFDKVFYVCFALTLLCVFQRILQCIADVMLLQFKQRNPKNYNMNKLLLDLSMSIIRLLVWLFVIIFILQEVFLFKVTHLIASAGIFGLAVAFAAKDTIANIFGAFSILGSKMFKVGDAIKVGASEGVVDQIGVRSIRIRAFNDGRVIDIPNHIIADSLVENFSTRLYWKEHFCFGLVYDTTPEQMQLAQKILTEISKDLAQYLMKGKPVQFDFTLFDSSSMNIEGDVWFHVPDALAKNRARSLFNEEVLKRFNAAGLGFAFPTTTVVMEPKQEK